MSAVNHHRTGTRALPLQAVLPQTEVQKELPISTEEIYRRFAERVACWAYRLGGMQLDVEEVVQDVFTVVQERIGGFRGTALPTWLYRITENVVRNKRKREGWRRWLSGGFHAAEPQLPSLAPSALERLTQAQTDAAVNRVLDRMSERYRNLLVLFEFEGLSGQEIAELQGLRLSTVWVTLHRARAQFVERLAELTAKERPWRKR